MDPFKSLGKRLKRAAKAAGYEKVAEQRHPEAFGSAVMTFRRGDREVRLVWDGKDGHGYLEARDSAEAEWRIASRHLSERQLVEEPLEVEGWEAELGRVLGTG